jgi:uncharacterized protein (TIGR02099 family)
MIKKTIGYVLSFVIGLLFVIAGCLLTLRLLLPNIDQYNEEITGYLSQKLNKTVTIDSIKAQWQQANPEFVISGIKIHDNGDESRTLNIAKIHAKIDILHSLFTLTPVFKKLSIEHLQTQIAQVNGRWQSIFSQTQSGKVVTQNSVETSAEGIQKLLSVLSRQAKIEFVNTIISLKPEGRAWRKLGPMQLALENDGQLHQLSGHAKLLYYGQSSVVQFSAQAAKLSDNIAQTPVTLYAKFDQLSEQLLQYNTFDLGIDIDKLSLNAEVWASFKQGVISDVLGSIDIPKLTFKHNGYPQLSNSSVKFSVASNAEQTTLQLSDINLSNGADHLVIDAVSAMIEHKDKTILKSVSVSNIDLAVMTALLKKITVLNDKVMELIESLELSGALANLNAHWGSQGMLDMELTADLKRVSVESYIGAPALSGVTGLLKMTPFTGEVHLDTTDFDMAFPKLFPEKWRYEKAQGTVGWQVLLAEGKPEHVLVNSQLLSLANKEMRASGRFSLDIPVDKEQQAELTLLIGMSNEKLNNVMPYIPKGIISDKLYSWIDNAILSGSLNKGGFLLRTGIRKEVEDDSAPSVQMFFETQQAKVNFDANWPNFIADDLNVLIEDKAVSVDSSQGFIADNKVTDLLVSNIVNNNELSVSANISGDLDTLYTKIKQKPVAAQVPEVLRGWQLKGDHQSKITIVIPLSKESEQSEKSNEIAAKKPYINVASTLKNALIKDDKYQLLLSDINGSLNFDSLVGINSDKVTLTSEGYPGSVDIVSQNTDNLLKTSVSLNGSVKVADIAKKVNSTQLSRVTGVASYNARVDFCIYSASCNQLVVNSDLSGVAIDLPAPWGKSVKSASKLQLVNTSNDKGVTTWLYNYADIIRGISIIPSEPKQEASTLIRLGGEKPDRPMRKGVSIDGILKNVDVAALMTQFSNAKVASKSSNGAAGLSILKAVDLKLQNVSVLGQSLGSSAWLSLQQTSNHWLARFNSAIAVGQVKYPYNSKEKVQVDLEKLAVNTSDSTKKTKGNTAKDSPLSLDSSAWPRVELSIKELDINNLNVGYWSASLAPTSGGYKVANIVGVLADTLINADVSWARKEKNTQSYLSLNAKGGDFGAVLTQFGYAKVLENKSGEIQASLSWPDYPWDFDQAKLNGRASFSLKEGRIIEAGTSANFLRIFGILNLNAVIKRLRLNFSDLLESGVTFDSVTGKYYLQNGVATSEEPLNLKGSSAAMQMTGTINFIDKTLDNKMTVEIPLSSNAPIAALLLASPQVAGIAFVVDKLLGKTLAKWTALKYEVSGSWFDPNIKVMNLGK